VGINGKMLGEILYVRGCCRVNMLERTYKHRQILQSAYHHIYILTSKCTMQCTVQYNNILSTHVLHTVPHTYRAGLHQFSSAALDCSSQPVSFAKAHHPCSLRTEVTQTLASLPCLALPCSTGTTFQHDAAPETGDLPLAHVRR
jgi:hypothetical protein